MAHNEVRVYRTREQAKLPVRAHNTDAGMDFFFCPAENIGVTIPPKSAALLQTGIKMQVPPGSMLQIMNKSGIASKRQLVVGACVVDEGYDGEIFVNLHNVGNVSQTIEAGQKIAQGVFVQIQKPELKEVFEDNVYTEKTSRGSGALGSTGDR